MYFSLYFTKIFFDEYLSRRFVRFWFFCFFGISTYPWDPHIWYFVWDGFLSFSSWGILDPRELCKNSASKKFFIVFVLILKVVAEIWTYNLFYLCIIIPSPLHCTAVQYTDLQKYKYLVTICFYQIWKLELPWTTLTEINF